MKNNLFDDFDPISKSQWIEQATKDLKGKDFREALVSETLDGIKIWPFYTAEDAVISKDLKVYQNKFHPAPKIPGLSPRVWSNVLFVSETDTKEGNKQILEGLMNGCDALFLQVSANTDLDTLLKNVEIAYIQLYIKPEEGVCPTDVMNNLLKWAKTKGFDKEQLNGGLLWDPLSVLLKVEGKLEEKINVAKSLIKGLSEFPDFSALTLDFSVYHEAGGTVLDELKYTFAGFIELLDKLTEMGMQSEAIFKNTMLRFSVGARYFEEISKVRTARIFYEALAQLYSVNFPTEDIKVFCQSSTWTKSGLDVYTNMLRNTTEGMAAILGGCNALWIRPHDEVTGITTAFSRRMSRNISNILKEESYLDKVVDPVAGSFFIESLTAHLLDKLKAELLIIEQQGGWYKMFSDKSMQETIKGRRNKRQVEVLNGEVVKIGANRYRQDKDVLRFTVNDEIQEADWQLFGARETELLEEKSRISS